jgi:hypothetical protein
MKGTLGLEIIRESETFVNEDELLSLPLVPWLDSPAYDSMKQKQISQYHAP